MFKTTLAVLVAVGALAAPAHAGPGSDIGATVCGVLGPDLTGKPSSDYAKMSGVAFAFMEKYGVSQDSAMHMITDSVHEYCPKYSDDIDHAIRYGQ